MALTTHTAWTFAHNGSEFASPSYQGAGPVTSSPAGPNGETYCHNVGNVGAGPGTSGEWIGPSANTGTTDWVTVGAQVRFPDLTTDASFDFLYITDGGNNLITFTTTSNTSVIIKDQGGSTIATLSGILAVDTWYRITTKFKVSNTSPVRVWFREADNLLNGSPVVSVSSADCDQGAGGAAIQVYHVNNALPQATNINTYIASGYIATDSETLIDTQAPRRRYWSREAKHDVTTATSDFGGSNLTSSTTWDQANENPLTTANKAIFDNGGTTQTGGCTADNSSTGGPLNYDGGNGYSVGNGEVFWNGHAVWWGTSNLDSKKAQYCSFNFLWGAHATATTNGCSSTLLGQDTTAGGVLHTVESVSGDAEFSGNSKYMQHGMKATQEGTGTSGSTYMYDGWMLWMYEDPAPRLMVLNGISQWLPT